MNPLDLPGPEFLVLYLVVIAVAFVLYYAILFILKLPAGGQNYQGTDLSMDEVAYLAGGPRGVVEAALTRMFRAGTIDVLKGRNGWFTKGKQRIPPATRMEQEALSYMSERAVEFLEILSHLSPLAESVSRGLVEKGLALSKGRKVLIAVLPLIPLCVVLGIGVVKIYIGISRNRPVVFLALLCLVLMAAIVLMFGSKNHLTVRGSSLLERLQLKNIALCRRAKSYQQQLSDSDLVYAMALCGPQVLDCAPLEEFYVAMYPRSVGSSTTLSSWLAGSGCGGGFGCGGGGGCGGCGGCGG